MTDGTFRTWEKIALAIGFVLLMFAIFWGCLANGNIANRDPDIKLSLIAVGVAATGLFAKPVWLLGNWKEIHTWERTTAFVRKSYTTGRGKGTRHCIYIEFFAKDGKTYHKTLEFIFPTMFKVGDKNDIMFAKEYIDALIFVPQAFRQAVIFAVVGVLIECVTVISLIAFC